MTPLKSPDWTSVGPPGALVDALRRVLADSLRSGSALLARLARKMSRPARQTRATEPHIEFYAEAGASEGALYLDGRLVGWVAGVRRL